MQHAPWLFTTLCVPLGLKLALYLGYGCPLDIIINTHTQLLNDSNEDVFYQRPLSELLPEDCHLIEDFQKGKYHKHLYLFLKLASQNGCLYLWELIFMECLLTCNHTENYCSHLSKLIDIMTMNNNSKQLSRPQI